MLKLQNVSIETIKGRKLIEDLSFSLNKEDRLAIIGEEGNGKSTLLKAIYDKDLISSYCNVQGTIDTRGEILGYLEQKLSNNWGAFTILDYFLKENPSSEDDYAVYEYFDKIEKKLTEFGLDKKILEDNTLIKNLSGGEQVKLQMVKILCKNPTVLLLDEPTNDLDINTLEWLENFIKSSELPIIFISHDETLLENCANRILHIEQLMKKSKPKFTLVKCSYDEYIDSRRRGIEKQTQIAYNERREKAKQEEILRQIKQKVENSLNASKKDPSNGRIVAKKMANIKAQEKKLQDEELTEIPEVEEAINLIVDKNIVVPNQKKVIDVNIKELKVGGKKLSQNIEFKIFGPQKVAITGNNGCGKTTFLKTILPVLQNTSGLKIGYFSQNYSENLNYSATPVEELQEANSKLNPRTLLGCLKFTREEMEHKISDLSEGQKAKILITKLIVQKNNVLVLDEPTRNLSPLSNPIIRGVLKKFNGVIITVSHDRKFINEICNEVYNLDKEGLKKIELKKKNFIENNEEVEKF